MNLEEELEELESAEDFMQFFGLEYDTTVVHVNRLHILQRFHDYLDKGGDSIPEDETSKRAVYQQLLARAYHDFEKSDAQTEKVFKVFKMGEPQTVFISLGDIKT
ncbi:MAG: nitrogenase-stabilizing/protective protein NifW [Methylococcales bacterium]|nr:nitrogenase-stabilizing/protective protein NifW [Methylococcales bacterium]